MDFIRNLASDPGPMRAHIDSGCRECARTLNLLSEAYHAARELAAVEVPSGTAARAKAMFPSRAPAGLFDLRWIAAKLAFESTPGMAAAGVRGPGASPGITQRTFEAGDFVLHLREEPAPGDLRVLIGQVEPAEGVSGKSSGLAVFLIGGAKQLLGRAMTNEYGEFQLEFQRRGKLRLLIPVPDVSAGLEFEL
jgi:hypothetical protein